MSARLSLPPAVRHALSDVALAAAPLGLAVWFAAPADAVVIDDAFITFRHADFAAQGWGLSYLRSAHVEGTSSLLFALLLVPPALLGADLLSAARGLCWAAFAAQLVLVVRLARAGRRTARGALVGVGAGALAATSTTLTNYVGTGMETLLHTGLVTWAVHEQLVARGRSAGAALRRGAPLALLPWSRPEGFLLATLIVLVGHAGELRQYRSSHAAWLGGAWVRDGAVVLASLCGLAALRAAYYGAAIPTSMLAKRGFLEAVLALPLSEWLRSVLTSRGVTQWVDFVGPRSSAVWVVGLGLLSAVHRQTSAQFLGVFGLCSLVLVAGGGDWMPDYRHLAPALPLLSVAVAAGLDVATDVERAGSARSRALSGAALLLGFGLIGPSVALDDVQQRSVDRQDVRAMEEIGDFLRAVGRSDDVLATTIAGIVPYRSRMETIDMYGLASPEIARAGRWKPDMGRENHGWVLAQQPEFLALRFWSELSQVHRLLDARGTPDQYHVVLLPSYLGYATGDPPMLLVRADRLADDPRLAGVGTVPASDELRRLRLIR